MTKPIVFVSCGQYTDDEKTLGKAVCEVIETETEYSAYFAEQQNTFDGLVSNVLTALGRAGAFVAILHQRGDVNTPSGHLTRGSVWIEQELAVGAFVHHVLKRPLEVALYLQRGVALEGVRQQLLLGPVVFDTSDDVLEDLRQRVKSWDLTLAGRRSLIANTRWIHSAPPETGRHVYKLFIDLVNNGLEKIDEWKAEVWFPSEYIEGADRTQEFVYLRESDTDYSEEARRIWPGDPPRPAFNIDYFVNNENWPGRPLWPGEKRAERQVRLRVSGGDQPWERTIPIRALQNF